MNITTGILLLFFIPSLTFAWIILPNGVSFRPSSTFPLLLSQDNNNAMVNFRNNHQPTSSDSVINTKLDEDVMDMLRIIVQAADGRKASEIVALHVTECTSLCDVMVICSGNSRLQNQAIAKSIEKDLMDVSQVVVVPQGTADSGWMLLDYGSIMIHVMTPKSRLYYNLEGQWVDKGGQYMTLEHWMQLPNTTVRYNKEKVAVPWKIRYK